MQPRDLTVPRKHQCIESDLQPHPTIRVHCSGREIQAAWEAGVSPRIPRPPHFKLAFDPFPSM
jgi:hypothetical protein